MSLSIISKQVLTDGIKRVDVYAPGIAQRQRPGQFCIVIAEKSGERIPLAIIDADRVKGSISFVFKEDSAAKKFLGGIHIGESVYAILGPLGKPATIKSVGTVVCVSSGIGIARILPICRAFRNASNKVISLIGEQTKKAVILQPQMRIASTRVFIATEDASYDKRGTVSNLLRQTLGNETVQLVYAIGGIDMLEDISRVTKEKNIPTLVGVSVPVFDGLGMSGSSYVEVDGKIVSASVEGPEFDGHKVNYSVLRSKKVDTDIVFDPAQRNAAFGVPTKFGFFR